MCYHFLYTLTKPRLKHASVKVGRESSKWHQTPLELLGTLLVNHRIARLSHLSPISVEQLRI